MSGGGGGRGYLVETVLKLRYAVGVHDGGVAGCRQIAEVERIVVSISKGSGQQGSQNEI